MTPQPIFFIVPWREPLFTFLRAASRRILRVPRRWLPLFFCTLPFASSFTAFAQTDWLERLDESLFI